MSRLTAFTCRHGRIGSSSSMIQQRVVAVVVTYAIGDRNLALLASWRIPVLFVDCLPPDTAEPYPSIATDNFSASLAMGNHLASLGYRRWCLVGHARNWNTREPRQRGFEAAATYCGAQVEIVEGGNDAEIAHRSVIGLLTRLPVEERPHALYASNTVLLKGVLFALRDCAIEVPRQMAVVAFDDFDWAPILHPPMTVIDQHIALIGRTAGAQLLGACLLNPGEMGFEPLKPVGELDAANLRIRFDVRLGGSFAAIVRCTVSEVAKLSRLRVRPGTGSAPGRASRYCGRGRRGPTRRRPSRRRARETDGSRAPA